MTAAISAVDLKKALHAPGEIALIDVREAGECGEGRPLLAVNLPYSVLEHRAPALLPSLTTPIVALDDGDGDTRAELAVRRLLGLGYTSVRVLENGLAGWRAAGYAVFKGVNVPSKTFGELLEHACHTPSIGADELAALRDSESPPVILDGRTPAEHHRMSIPGGISCPNGELALRAADLSDPEDLIVINCAGRTRSIVGAQTLIDLGVPNRVVALRNGTMGWRLAGFELDHGATARHALTADAVGTESARARARSLADADGIPYVTGAEVDAWLATGDRAVYLLDVRTAEEFADGHQPGAVHAPGGQLVQATDHWVAARGARLVLIDAEEVRAPMAARWLNCMGHDVSVLRAGESVKPTAPGVTFEPALLPTLETAGLAPDTCLIDLRSSGAFGAGHLDGAAWSIRPMLSGVAVSGPVALVADDPVTAALAAVDLRERDVDVLGWLPADVEGWQRAGLNVESSPVPDEQRIDYLFFVHDRHDGNMDAAREYLKWETGLVDQLDADERALFTL